MRKRTEKNSNGEFFTTEALVSYHKLVKKTIQEYTEELARRCRYKSVVSQVDNGVVMDDRSRLIDLYDSCYVQNAHLQGVQETLYSMLTGDRYMLARQNENGKWVKDVKQSKIAQGTQFEKIIKGALDAMMYGYTLLEISNKVDEKTGRLVEVNSIERRNVLPDQRRVVQTQHQWSPGWDIDQEQYKHNYVLINSGGFGMYAATTPLILAQKYTLSNWVNFSHTYGQPIIHGKTISEDSASRRKLANDMASAAQNKIIVTGKDDEIDIKNFAASNSEKIYDNLIAYVDKCVSNLILGSESMAGGDQSYVGSTKAHEEILRARIKTYRNYIENVINEQVLPILKYWNLIEEDVFFKYSKQVDMSNKDKIELTKLLVTNYEFSSDEVENLWGVTVGKQRVETFGGFGEDGLVEGENDHHIMSDEEYYKRYGHARGVKPKNDEKKGKSSEDGDYDFSHTKNRINFLKGMRKK